MVLQVYLPEETLERTVRRVVMDFPKHGLVEYLIRFEHARGPYYLGNAYVNPSLLERGNRAWIQENVGITVWQLPQRVACTGSMRPVIHCGDLAEPPTHNSYLVLDRSPEFDGWPVGGTASGRSQSE